MDTTIEPGETRIVDAYGRILRLPSAVDDGSGVGDCNDHNAIAFGVELSSSCMRRITNLAQQCEVLFNVNRFVSDLFGEDHYFDCLSISYFFPLDF
mmetsp:Transcript_27905/g.41136  ORF Transcript_27905/g.41136 Transcript_27905/m.41136 type:complete len:96 (+) Transcript_27905:368-655(+)